MKKIFKIAKTELQTLFYSPIAWLILVLFFLQSAIAFNQVFGGIVADKDLGEPLWALSSQVFYGWRGLFKAIQKNLYLYIPLLTMSLMSREYQSGSIKLLYSSPVTNTQIILGKYLSMMIYSLAMTAVLFVFVLFSGITIENFDWPAILVGLLGLYLLMCTYSAIGLFMSSITSYQIIAAVLTLAVLSGMSLLKTVGQDIEFVRDLTYWLSLDGRVGTFVNGMLCSEDLIYFIAVSAMFVILSIIRLSCHRQKTPAGKATLKYLAVICATLLVGFVSSRPALMGYWDATRDDSNTIAKGSQEIMQKLKGKVEVHTYSNLFDRHWHYGIPRDVKYDQQRLEKFVRFKPDIKLKYHYYYDTLTNDLEWNKQMQARFDTLTFAERAEKIAGTYNIDFDIYKSGEEQKQILDLSDEGNRFVRQLIFHNAETKEVKTTWLRIFDDMYVMPFETEIAAAFKRLSDDLPAVAFLKGHGERDAEKLGDREYNRFAQDKPFRSSLINQGFSFKTADLNTPIPEDINILVIAEPKTDFSEVEVENFEKYLARGGNVYISGEPRRLEVMNNLVARFGVRFFDGTLVRNTEKYAPDLVVGEPTIAADSLSWKFNEMRRYRYKVTMTGACGIDTTGVDTSVYKLTTVFKTEEDYWNESQTTDFIDEVAEYNPETGEIKDKFAVAIALERKVGDRDQKIFIAGDSDCIGNGEISLQRKDIRSMNYKMIEGALNWLTDGEIPVDTRGIPNIDNDVFLGIKAWRFFKFLFALIIPLAMAIFATFLCIRRKSR